MSFPFQAERGLIIVKAELWGSTGSGVLRLALDTGATRTLVNVGVLVALGYDPALTPERVQVTTGSGVEFSPQVTVDRIAALDQVKEQFSILAHTLPPSANVDGLLGLDFLRGQRLVIDFRTGEIEVL
jgi:predicted aspartyl protease